MYMLSPDQLSDYRAGKSFSAVEHEERVQSWSWNDISVDYDGELTMVIDNRDNGRSDDTPPYFNATYELTFWVNEGSDAQMIFCCIVLPIVTVILVIVGVWQFMKMRRKKRAEDRAREYSMYGPGSGGGGGRGP